MTCIVGLAHKGRVYIGGDSAGVYPVDYSLTVRADEKVFRVGPFLIGFTTSFRMGQLLKYKLHVPEQGSQADHAYLVTTFIDAVRDCLKHGGFARKDAEQEIGGMFLVGYKGSLYTVDSDYQVGQTVDGIGAVGCGAATALGALYVTRGQPRQRLLKALAAAERFSAGVRGPFLVLSA